MNILLRLFRCISSHRLAGWWALVPWLALTVTCPEAVGQAPLAPDSLGLPITGPPPHASHQVTPRIFDREPFGFDAHTFEYVAEYITGMGAGLLRWFESWADLTALEVSQQAAPWLIVCLFALALWWGDRRIHGFLRDIAYVSQQSDRVRPQWRPWLAAVLRVAGRTGAWALAMLLSYVPVQGVFPNAGWSRSLSEILWLILAARALGGIAVELMHSELVQLEENERERLSTFASRAPLVAALAMSVDVTVFHFGARSDVHRLVYFLFRATMAGLGVWAFTLRHEMTALLRPREPGRYAELWHLIERLLLWVLGLSVALLMLYTLGFRRLAITVLPRSYAVIGVFAAGFSLKRAAERWLHQATDRPSHILRRLVASLTDSFGRFCLFLVLFLVALNLAGLYDPTVMVLQKPLFMVGKTAITLYNLLKGIVIIVGAILVSRVLRLFLDAAFLSRRGFDEGLSYAISTSLHYVLVVFGVGMALVTVGLDLSAMAVFAGALGVGIGLGLQEITRNIVSGFILLYGGSVKKGDLITVGDKHFGRVSAIGARSVSVQTSDDLDLVIPSNDLVNSTIINWTRRSPYVRLHVTLGVAYESDIWKVREALLEAARRFECIHAPELADVWLTGFGDSSIDFELVVWVDLSRYPRDGTKGKILFYVMDEFKRRGIEIPFPQRDLHIRTAFGSSDPAALGFARVAAPSSLPVPGTSPSTSPSHVPPVDDSPPLPGAPKTGAP